MARFTKAKITRNSGDKKFPTRYTILIMLLISLGISGLTQVIHWDLIVMGMYFGRSTLNNVTIAHYVFIFLIAPVIFAFLGWFSGRSVSKKKRIKKKVAGTNRYTRWVNKYFRRKRLARKAAKTYKPSNKESHRFEIFFASGFAFFVFLLGRSPKG